MSNEVLISVSSGVVTALSLNVIESGSGAGVGSGVEYPPPPPPQEYSNPSRTTLMIFLNFIESKILINVK
jgi:hypothetical protein